MAVGDAVNGLGATSFQPAAGVTICITSCAWWDGYIQITNGALVGYVTATFNGANNTYNPNTKIFINNTNYLAFYGGSAVQEENYSGIQTA